MNDISFYGIETHNLKSIDVKIPKNKVTVIYGRTGAGKSSLAFSSIYQLCRDEFDAIECGYVEESEYRIKKYCNVIPAVAIAQKNTNQNPRSTLYSFLNIHQKITSLLLEMPHNTQYFNNLKINKIDNECTRCQGLGEIEEISMKDLINENSRLSEKPFECWKSGELSDYYNQLLIVYCNHIGIDKNKKFKDLTDKDKEQLLYPSNKEKLTVKYRIKGKTKQRSTQYKGVINYIEESLQSTGEHYKKRITCPSCLGARVNKKIAEVNILGLSFSEILLSPISYLCDKLQKDKGTKDSFLCKSLSSINTVGLGYLSLSRSIPSLSGGELQKILFSKLLNSNITGILVVIDEISSQLSESDYSMIWKGIEILAKNNTVVLVEHDRFFIEKSDFRIHIGMHPGEQGGYICDDEDIQFRSNSNTRNIISKFLNFEGITKNNIINQSVSLPEKCVTLLVGVSGSGKSSLAKAICEKHDSLYISQRISNLPANSTVASFTKANILIADYFSRITGLDRDFFIPTKLGSCPACEGRGIIKYERGFENDIYKPCHECDGKLFNSQLPELNVKVSGLSIAELYDTEISSLIDFFDNKKISEILSTMQDLSLSHLKLNRRSQTLSGGESRRIKLCEHFSRVRETGKLLLIDEPTAGLDQETASNVLDLIYKKTTLFKGVVLIEHRSEALDYADFLITIGPSSGKNGGIIISQKYLSD